jgi:VCBS repeat-containing protein
MTVHDRAQDAEGAGETATIGTVEAHEGAVTVARADGSVFRPEAGDTLVAGDIVDTGGDGSLSVALGDGGILSVGEATRLLIKGFAGDAGGGGMSFVAVSGTFVVIAPEAGPAAHPSIIETANGVITLEDGSVLVDHRDGQALRFTLLPNQDGSLGEVGFENDAAALAIDTPYQVYSVAGGEADAVFEAGLDCAEVAGGAGGLGDLVAGLCTTEAAGEAHGDGDAAEQVALAENVSPGGDMNDMPGDAIDVTAAPETFDLTPTAATLVDAPAAAPTTDPGGDATGGEHRTEEALFLNQAQAAAPLTVSLPEPLILRDWDPGRNWDGLGRADEFEGRVPEVPLESTRLIQSRQGAMAQLEASDVSIVQIETFLGLETGALSQLGDGGQPSTGAAIRARSAVSLDAGESIRFDTFFDAATARPFNDFAVFTVSTKDGIDAVPVGSVVDVGDFGASGWQRVQFTAGADGNYTFGFAVLNDQGNAGLSRLYVDNVAAGDPGAFPFQSIDGGTSVAGGTVARFAPSPLAVADRYTVNEDARFVTTAANGPLANDADPDAFDAMRIVGLDAAGTIGRISVEPENALSYDPRGRLDALAAGETREETAAYVVDGGNGLTSRGTVTFVVEGVNDAPIARPDTARLTVGDAPLAIDVTVNDSDIDSDDTAQTLQVVSAVAASGAEVAFDGPPGGGLVYDPSNVAHFQDLGDGDTATDTITYAIRDRHGAEASSTVTVSLLGRGEDPGDGTGGGPGGGSGGPGPALTTDEDTPQSFTAAAVLEAAFGRDGAETLSLVGIDGSDAAGTFALAGDTVTYDPRGALDRLASGSDAVETVAVTAEDTAGQSVVGEARVVVAGVNDAPLAADDAYQTDEASRITVDVRGNDTDAEGGAIDVVDVDVSGTRGAVIINQDGTLTYDPQGAFDALVAGETATDSFQYTVHDADGGTDTATAEVRVAGLNDLERPIDSFERDLLPQDRVNAFARTVSDYQETDGGQGLFRPTDGARMVEMEARGSTVPRLEAFLGLGEGDLPSDSDGSAPAFGSAIRLSVDVNAGDRLVFDWMFDARDFVNAPPDGLSDNDFAIVTFSGEDGTEAFKLSDVRQVGDQGASGFRTSAFTASKAETLTIGIGVVNDRGAEFSGPEAQNSFLLVDNVRVNGEVGDGYQVVDSQAGGTFETFAQPTA